MEVLKKKQVSLKSPVKKQEDYPYQPNKKTNGIGIPIGLAWFLLDTILEEKEKERKVKVKKSSLENMISKMVESGISDEKIKAVVMKKSGYEIIDEKTKDEIYYFLKDLKKLRNKYYFIDDYYEEIGIIGEDLDLIINKLEPYTKEFPGEE